MSKFKSKSVETKIPFTYHAYEYGSKPPFTSGDKLIGSPSHIVISSGKKVSTKAGKT